MWKCWEGFVFFTRSYFEHVYIFSKPPFASYSNLQELLPSLKESKSLIVNSPFQHCLENEPMKCIVSCLWCVQSLWVIIIRSPQHHGGGPVELQDSSAFETVWFSCGFLILGSLLTLVTLYVGWAGSISNGNKLLLSLQNFMKSRVTPSTLLLEMKN